MKRPQWLRRSWARWTAGRAADGTPVRGAWTALHGVHDDEARAGALLRQAIVREPMSDTQLAAVRARLRRNRAPAPRGARLAQIAVGLAVMLAAGVLLAAARRFLSWPVSEPAPPAVSVKAEPRAVHGHARRRAAAEVAALPAAPVAPAEEPIPAIPEPASLLPVAPPRAPRPARAGASRPTARAAVAVDEPAPAAEAPASVEQPPPSLVTSRLAEESRLLTLALRKLRQDNDPAGALVTLDEHARRFGTLGALAAEADTARVEALLRLGRHGDALVRLEGLALAPAGSSRGLLAARAELRAEQGRCTAAMIDFDRLLARAGEHDAIVERALHGRAGCRAQVGDVAGARADLETYLERFPDGRFAAEARATLRR